jgi:hypothetical protein
MDNTQPNQPTHGLHPLVRALAEELIRMDEQIEELQLDQRVTPRQSIYGDLFRDTLSAESNQSFEVQSERVRRKHTEQMLQGTVKTYNLLTDSWKNIWLFLEHYLDTLPKPVAEMVTNLSDGVKELELLEAPVSFDSANIRVIRSGENFTYGSKVPVGPWSFSPASSKGIDIDQFNEDALGAGDEGSPAEDVPQAIEVLEGEFKVQ